MGVLLAIALVIVVAWFLIRVLRAEPAAARPSELEIERLLEALYRDGARLGYERAWAQQIEAEQHRVGTFVRRRTTVMLTAGAGAALVGALPLGAALEVLPNQQAWLPDLARWQWLALASAALVSFMGLGALIRPRNYRDYFATRTATAVELSRIDAEVSELVAARLALHLDAAKAYLAALGQEQYGKGLEQGRAEAKQAHGRPAQESVPADLQARVSSAANSAYVQGRNDGVEAARAELNEFASEAYARGTRDGRRSALAELEGRLRAEREAAYRSGYRSGEADGRARGAREAPASGPGTAPAVRRPRTRAEALAILELREAATQADIERQYRLLRTAVHPDAIRSKKLPAAVVKFAEEQFKLVGEAYDILTR